MKPTFNVLSALAFLWVASCETSTPVPGPGQPPDAGVTTPHEPPNDSGVRTLGDAAPPTPDPAPPSPDASRPDLGRLADTGAPGAPEAGSSDAADTSGFPRDTLVSRLTPAEAARLCDWISGKQGGYGRHVTCADGHEEQTDDSLIACVQAFIDGRAMLEKCALNIAQIEDCAQAVGLDLCKFTSASECKALNACSQQ